MSIKILSLILFLKTITEKHGYNSDPDQCSDKCQSALNRISLLETNMKGNVQINFDIFFKTNLILHEMSFLSAFQECVYSCINGKCVNGSNTFVCFCNSGYAGANCNESKTMFDILLIILH